MNIDLYEALQKIFGRVADASPEGMLGCGGFRRAGSWRNMDIKSSILTSIGSFQIEKDKICKPVLVYFMTRVLQRHRQSRRSERLMGSFIFKRVRLAKQPILNGYLTSEQRKKQIGHSPLYSAPKYSTPPYRNPHHPTSLQIHLYSPLHTPLQAMILHDREHHLIMSLIPLFRSP